MTIQNSLNNSDFDEFSSGYDVALAHGLSATGESKNYFARGRIAWLASCLRQLHEQPHVVMDFGCGTGSAVPFMLELLPVKTLFGVDVSNNSLEIARRTVNSERTRFLPFREYQTKEEIDLAFCNGVFHHIPPAERATKINYIYRALRPGGLFAFWENNPWNPGTRYVMSRIPFDRDAVTITHFEAKRTLQIGGFDILRTDFLFIFPNSLRWLRGIETFFSRLPFGGQYQVLCRKPFSNS